MLSTYYRGLFLLSGDLSNRLLGPLVDRGQDDIEFLNAFLMNSSAAGTTFFYWAGSGFAESEWNSGPSHQSFLTSKLGLSLRSGSYRLLSPNTSSGVRLFTAGPIAGDVYSLDGTPTTNNDVFTLQPGAVASGFYEPIGSQPPYISGVNTPINLGAGKFYTSYVDGWDVQDLVSEYGGSSLGRLGYYFKLFTNIQATQGCQIQGTPLVTLDVPASVDVRLESFEIRNNPARAGHAVVHLSLNHTDRVTVVICDVSGRLLRHLVNRSFSVGSYDLVWDGMDDSGRRLQPGVYFAQLRRTGSGATSRKITILN